MCVELNGIDQLADEEQPPASSLIELLGADRLRDSRWIEARPFVGDVHSDGIRYELGTDIHPLIAIFAVAPNDGVTECLGEDYPKTEPGGLGSVVPGQAVPGDELDCFFNAVDVTGKPQGHQGGGSSRVRGRGAADTEAER